MKVLGIDVDEVDRQKAMDKIAGWIGGKGRVKHIVTIYSEFFLAAEKDKEFKKAMSKADLVVPDGVGVLASLRYGQEMLDSPPCHPERSRGISFNRKSISHRDSSTRRLGRNDIRRILCGLRVGLKGLRGELGEPVTGVWLFEELIRLAAKNGWKVFLLGGFGDTAERLKKKLQISNFKLQIEADAGEQRVALLRSGELRKGGIGENKIPFTSIKTSYGCLSDIAIGIDTEPVEE